MRVCILLAAIALVGLGAFASACNDDGEPLTLEQYFERVSELDEQQREASDELERELGEFGGDVTVDQFADEFEAQVEVLREFAAEMSDLDPPDEVRDLHDRIVEGLDAGTDELDEVIDDFRDSDSIEAGFAALNEVETSALDTALEACVDLEQLAADNNIEVDFDCGDAS